jgi:hypothetical protein
VITDSLRERPRLYVHIAPTQAYYPLFIFLMIGIILENICNSALRQREAFDRAASRNQRKNEKLPRAGQYKYYQMGRADWVRQRGNPMRQRFTIFLLHRPLSAVWEILLLSHQTNWLGQKVGNLSQRYSLCQIVSDVVSKWITSLRVGLFWIRQCFWLTGTARRSIFRVACHNHMRVNRLGRLFGVLLKVLPESSLFVGKWLQG